MAMCFETCSEADTLAFGRALGAQLRPGEALLLSGDLGAGKSVLARGAARALGVEGPMPSPSFTILFPYEGTFPVYHFDLYRLSSPEELDSLGFDEYVSSGICIAEWPDMLGDDLPENAVKVYIRRIGENEREITAEGIEDIADADGGDSRR